MTVVVPTPTEQMLPQHLLVAGEDKSGGGKEEGGKKEKLPHVGVDYPAGHGGEEEEEEGEDDEEGEEEGEMAAEGEEEGAAAASSRNASLLFSSGAPFASPHSFSSSSSTTRASSAPTRTPSATTASFFSTSASAPVFAPTATGTASGGDGGGAHFAPLGAPPPLPLNVGGSNVALNAAFAPLPDSPATPSHSSTVLPSSSPSALLVHSVLPLSAAALVLCAEGDRKTLKKLRRRFTAATRLTTTVRGVETLLCRFSFRFSFVIVRSLSLSLSLDHWSTSHILIFPPPPLHSFLFLLFCSVLRK